MISCLSALMRELVPYLLAVYKKNPCTFFLMHLKAVKERLHSTHTGCMSRDYTDLTVSILWSEASVECLPLFKVTEKL